MPNVSSNVQLSGVAVHREHAVLGVSTQILAANPGRKFLLVQNVGLVDVQINVAGGDPETSGIRLAPLGSILMDKFVSGSAVTARSFTGALAALVSVEGKP